MYDIIVFIKSFGENINRDNLYDTLRSLKSKIGNYKVGFYLVLDHSMFSTAMKSGIRDDIVEIKLADSSRSWAYDFNVFMSDYVDKTKWILISHDDLVVRTENFLDIVESLTKGKENLGWITFTSDYFYRVEKNPISASVRPGFSLDREESPRLFECHRFSKTHFGRTQSHLYLLDMPQENKLTKVFGVMSSLFMISSKSLKKVGYCSDWTPYTMLIDEDWSMKANQENLWNTWISNIYYIHPIRKSLRSAGNRYETEAHHAFIKKWGFYVGETLTLSEEFLRDLRSNYKDTLIPWSSYRNTYDWEYV